MWNRLTLVTAPVADPITLVEAKAHCRVDTADNDTLITSLITAAVAVVDGTRGIGRALMSQTWRYTCDTFPAEFVIPLGPVQSVTTVKYIDTAGVEQTILAADYRVDLGRDKAIIEPAFNKSWPTPRAISGAVYVDFLAGYASAALVPADIKQAILLIVGHWFENREAAVVGVSANELPLAVASILNRHRAGAVA